MSIGPLSSSAAMSSSGSMFSRDSQLPTTPDNVNNDSQSENIALAPASRKHQDFENQLNQQGIITLAQTKTGLIFNTADDIAENAVFSAPGQSNPI